MSNQHTTPRSYLFVPGDSARKMDKAATSSADAIILDLEDSVAPTRKAEALRVTADFLNACDSARPHPEFWVRVNASQPADALAELAALPLAHVSGIIHPKLGSHAQLERMGHWLDALEARDSIQGAPTGIVGIITETAASVVGEQARTLTRGHPRLRGYSWGTEDLSAVLGRPPIAGRTNANTALAQSMQMHCLMMAAAAGVDAIDSISANFRDLEALAAECDYARELGYTSKMAIHPAQLDTLHAGLAPGAEAIAWARQVRALVDANPDAASFQLDGRMVDQPHFNVAARILERAGETG
ncbi:HpcH/HpaI aldolase/citrate lyase family protein [Salinisphaera aquimarina]|uniref:HpcH/HpaI aldolase/citrate lyase family protein n=1 Tax=Salinisphaera aquimarina TaxID=2094031 RepID=A0ABV7ETX4_9GAMM